MFDIDPWENTKTSMMLPRSNKPRAKELNDALVRAHAGKMKNPKDVSRSKEKMKLRSMLEDFDYDE